MCPWLFSAGAGLAGSTVRECESPFLRRNRGTYLKTGKAVSCAIVFVASWKVLFMVLPQASNTTQKTNIQMKLKKVNRKVHGELVRGMCFLLIM